MHSRRLFLLGLLGCSPEFVPSLDSTSLSEQSPPQNRISGWLNCEEGTTCRPISVSNFPYHDERDTSLSPSNKLDRYVCAPNISEAGPEYVYQLEIEERGIISAYVNDHSRDGVEVDLHLLREPRADSCVSRGNKQVAWLAEPGMLYLVVDTWANDSGTTHPGAYRLDIKWSPLPQGKCAIVDSELEMFWKSCAPGIECHTQSLSGEDGVFLRLPAIGPVVEEAHLVTTQDQIEGLWPTQGVYKIDDHYALSEKISGVHMKRNEPWAPSGIADGVFGRGSTGKPVPVLAEAWYVNMYWKKRPRRGTRVIVMNPFNGRIVVGAAGYETGPGSNLAMAGAVEEVHYALGTKHKAPILMAFASDQSLPYGPIHCP